MGNKQTHVVALSKEERGFLIKNTKSGDWSPREVKRAQILLRADKNHEAKKDHEIADELHCIKNSSFICMVLFSNRA